MIKGHVVNNSGKSKHIFKKTVYPGQSVPLSHVYEVLSKKIDDDVSFIEWVRGKLPPGWELSVEEDFELPFDASAVTAEDLQPVEGDGDDGRESLEYAPMRVIDKLTARDIYNLRMKDNPKRVIKQITSVHKLRRALTMCLNDSRKSMLATILRHRIRDLNS
jgi:hypothetical protein